MTGLPPEAGADEPQEVRSDQTGVLPANLAERFAKLELELGRAASAAHNPARLGVHAVRLTGPGDGATSEDRNDAGGVAWRAYEQFPAASTIKVFVLQALLERVAAGELALEEERTVRECDYVTGSGVLKSLTPGRAHTLLDLATLMIVVSDNTATNVLIDAVGLERINASILQRGWRSTFLAGKLQVSAAARGSRPSPSLTSPFDLVDYFGRLWLGELLPPALTRLSQRIYRQQQYTELGRCLDHDPYTVELGVAPWRIASKSGSLRGVRNDAGVFEPRSGAAPLVVAVMTKGCPDERFHAENLGARVVGAAAAAVHARLMA